MEEIKNVFLFTHTDLDGIGCDILARKYYSNYPNRYNLYTFFCDYKTIDNIIETELLGCKLVPDIVYITDISVSDATAEKLDEYADKHNVILKLLDHHGTAMRLNKYEWASIVTSIAPEKNACGTFLLFKELYINPAYCNRAILEFVELVRLWDTYEFERDDTEMGIKAKELNYLFQAIPRDEFIEYISKFYISDDVDHFPEFESNYRNIIDGAIAKEDAVYDKADRELIIRDYNGYKMGFYFGGPYTSQVCNRLCKAHRDLDFVCCINTTYMTYEFRTIRNDLNLGKEIAPNFGGGGHPKAAGASISKEQINKIADVLFG